MILVGPCRRLLKFFKVFVTDIFLGASGCVRRAFVYMKVVFVEALVVVFMAVCSRACVLEGI